MATGRKRVGDKEHRKTNRSKHISTDRSKHPSLLSRPVSVIFATTSTPLSPHPPAPVNHRPLPPFPLKAASLQTVRVQSDSDCGPCTATYGHNAETIQNCNLKKTRWFMSLPNFCLVGLVYDMAKDLLFAKKLSCLMRTIKLLKERKKKNFDLFLVTVAL